jgi:predicted anti-sigma-YlaC factor YlaD
MSCEKYLQDIYLYDELSPEAREVIDEHVRSCAECRMLLEEVQQQSVWVKHASQARPEPAHPRQLTNAILVRIERRTPRATVVMRLVRYALAAVSVGLLVLFVSEQQYAPVVVTPAVQPAVSATLNTDAFLQQYAQEKEQPKSATPSWYQCLRDESCVASLLATRKQRKLSSL